jgi:hypothetical protein
VSRHRHVMHADVDPHIFNFAGLFTFIRLHQMNSFLVMTPITSPDLPSKRIRCPTTPVDPNHRYANTESRHRQYTYNYADFVNVRPEDPWRASR